MRKLFIVGAVLAASCTDTQMSELSAYGDPANVTCYSGGVVVFEGRSTGKVSSSTSSDGYLFRDASTRRLTEVSGDCVLQYGVRRARSDI